jgi:hypothetical protein
VRDTLIPPRPPLIPEAAFFAASGERMPRSGDYGVRIGVNNESFLCEFRWGRGRCQVGDGGTSGVSGGEFRLKYDTFR